MLQGIWEFSIWLCCQTNAVIRSYNGPQFISNHFLDILANRYCPVIKKLDVTYRWSIMQVEYAMDIVFRNPEDLKFLYDIIMTSSCISPSML